MTTLAAGVWTGKSLMAAHTLMLFQTDSINSGNSKLLEVFIGLAAFALLVQAAAVVGVALGLLKAQKTVLAEIAEIKGKVLPFVEKSHGLVDDLTPQIKDITAKTQTLIADLTPTVKSITAKTETLITDLTPTVKDITVKVQTLIGDLTPQIVGITTKVHSITGHVEEISTMAKDKVAEFGPTVSAANETVKQTNETVRAAVQDVNEKTRAQVDRVNGLVTGALDATVRLGKAIEHGITQPGREVAGLVSGAKVTVEHLVKRYGGLVNLSSLSGFGTLFNRKKKPAAAEPEPMPVAEAPVAPVHSYGPEGMGKVESTLPSAFGSTVKRDMDL